MQPNLEIDMLADNCSLDYVVLLCEDMPRMRAFYHEVLGFPIYRDWDGWLEMRVGAVLLTLRRRGRPYDGPKLPDTAGVQLAFRVTPADVDSCHAELLQKGVEIIEAPRDQEYGHRTLFFKDPEGNILEVYADI
jgi:catechol 2,3-dioxygenase-like lactoylglutathione lyase family enzyme